MTFAQRLDRIAGLTEARLTTLVGANSQDSEDTGRSPSRLFEALRHATLGGGKRFRPFLVVESAALFGLPEEAALDTAAALECVHCYSLVHDDLPAMDNDTLRRGQPTVWKAFDEWTAILAGDALLTVAFETLSAPSTHPNAEVRLALIAGLSKAAGMDGMVGGQALDLEAERLAASQELTVREILHLQSLKTGALIRFACEAGAMLGEASPDARAALGRYGDAIGRAFQIADDLLDAEGCAETVGKAVSKDAAAGKATLVGLLGIEAARAALAQAEQDAVSALEPFGVRADMLIEAARFVSRREH
ncbi:polyprenyl synthetase [Hyphomicrobium nitrativorans NL23]|uniref:Probable farnesyl diphosphate synthase n=1 Tax=Hyphomicrobium nitrativorans NL23 TaxID=1029756 RepID=V5SA43_9HYPH|nr:farnesyl diphosphate synthase [Hyphomicrobium nitrativorans]AHB47611.1 polyprenyl synthetase [Hyphomicrobium nitrativorans NL23]